MDILDEIKKVVGNDKHIEQDDAFHGRLFEHRDGVTFKCGKCHAAFHVSKYDIGAFSYWVNWDELAKSILFPLHYPQEPRHVICTTCPSCKELAVVVVKDASDFI